MPAIDTEYGRVKRSKSAKIYDDIAYGFKFVDDVQYELEFKELKDMQRMEHVLEFILHNLRSDAITPEACARIVGLNEEYFLRVFKEYFGITFNHFVVKLKLRQAARDIKSSHFPKGLGKIYGFSTAQSFSKAFTKEFGISPRKFYKGSFDAPDMPLRTKIKGLPLNMEYCQINSLYVEGTGLPPPRGDKTFYMDSTAFMYDDGFTLPDGSSPDLSPGKDKVSIWWYDEKHGMECIFGDVIIWYDSPYVKDEPAPSDPSKRHIMIQGGNYAVFSFERPESGDMIDLYSRMLSRYVFHEWVPMNQKVTDTMGYTFQCFTKDRVSFYLPLVSGMGIDDVIRPKTWSINSWAEYIDKNITSDLNTEALAKAAGYSTKNYRDVFSMYYGVSPADYMRNRRVYLAIKEMDEGANEARTLSKYHFASRESFAKSREEVRNTTGAALGMDGSGHLNLEEYYESNKDKVKIVYRDEKPRDILMHSIEESENGTVPDDITRRVAYWFLRDFRDFSPIEEYINMPEEKVFLWGNDAIIEDGQEIYQYYLGSVLVKGLTDEDRNDILEKTHARMETVCGGRYAVFSTVDETDEGKLRENIILLMRYAFGGYINEYRWRVDLSERTFVIWKAGKLYFYVPIIH